MTFLRVDAKSHSDYHKAMSNVTSRNDQYRCIRVEGFCRGLVYLVCAALPLCGLILFFEITRPAHFNSNGFITTKLSSLAPGNATRVSWPLRRHAVPRLRGVSAELRETSPLSADVFNASDAELAFASAPDASLKAGFRTEFVTKEHRRVAIRIIRREAIMDRAVPDNARLSAIVPASTASTVTFAWGSWLYVAEVEDKGIEPQVVVQEVL